VSAAANGEVRFCQQEPEYFRNDTRRRSPRLRRRGDSTCMGPAALVKPCAWRSADSLPPSAWLELPWRARNWRIVTVINRGLTPFTRSRRKRGGMFAQKPVA
jgi:hypothetical protein